jgi:hypothetical protein
LISLAALAVAADLIGIIAGTPAVQLLLSLGLLAAGLAILVVKKFRRVFQAPRLAGTGMLVAGLLVFSLGIYHLVAGRSEERRDAVAEVCAAAQDYSEAYIAATTVWATSGVRTADTQQADARTGENLERLSRAANLTEDDDIKVLVHDIRMRDSLGRGQTDTDVSSAIANLQGSWTSLGVLLDICTDKGVKVAKYGRLPVEPEVEAACRYLDDSFSFRSGIDDESLTDDQHRTFFGYINMFLYHGLNVADEEFKGKVLAFAQTIGKDLGGGFDRVGPVYGDCVSRGFKMKLAGAVPDKYITSN